MELEVLKLLYNYSIKEKVIDANFISRIFNSVIDNYNIKDLSLYCFFCLQLYK